jgi:hypothetical protein
LHRLPCELRGIPARELITLAAVARIEQPDE